MKHKILIGLLVALMMTAVAMAKPNAKPVDNIVDDANHLLYFYADDHAFNIYFKIWKNNGQHTKPLGSDNYKTIVNKGHKATSFGWGIKIQPKRKRVAEITSNYPLTQEGNKLKDDTYNIDFQKEADNGWTIEFEEITPTNWNVIIYKDDYHGVSHIEIDPVISSNVQTVFYTFTVCGNWTCNSYTTCQPDALGGYQPCVNVTGLPTGCDNATYEGDITQLNQSCDYCTPEWYCSTFDTCDYNTGFQNCINVTDRNDCYAQTNAPSDNFTGSLSTYRATCGQGISPALTETGQGTAEMVDQVRLPVGNFLLFFGIIGAIIGLVAGLIFAIKGIMNKRL